MTRCCTPSCSTGWSAGSTSPPHHAATAAAGPAPGEVVVLLLRPPPPLVGETVILLPPPLPLVGVSMVMERERQQNDSLSSGAGGSVAPSIGVLDIFGFETFGVNSLEQVRPTKTAVLHKCLNLSAVHTDSEGDPLGESNAFRRAGGRRRNQRDGMWVEWTGSRHLFSSARPPSGYSTGCDAARLGVHFTIGRPKLSIGRPI